MFDRLPSLSKERVIDVGCGDCKLSEDLLFNIFQIVHMLDVDKECIEKAKKLLEKKNKKGTTHWVDMRGFQPGNIFSCVVMRYSIGYMGNKSAIHFLEKMKKSLIERKNQQARATQRESYILI